MGEKKVCAKCGAETSVDASFCFNCGSNQFVDNRPEQNSDRICAKCGAPVTEDAAFCSACGSNQFISAKVSSGKKRCAKCGAEANDDAAFCTNCGSNQFVSGGVAAQAPEFKICKRCGTQAELSAAFCMECGYDQFIFGKNPGASGTGAAPHDKRKPANTSSDTQSHTATGSSGKRKGKKKLKWWGIVLIILGVCVIAAIGNAVEKNAQKKLAQDAFEKNSSLSAAADFSLNGNSSEETTADQPVINVPEYEEPVQDEEVDSQSAQSFPVFADDYYIGQPVIRAGQDSSFGYDFLRVIIPVQNAASEIKYLKDIRVTVCDADGSMIKELSAAAYPNVIAPGEFAYYVGDSSNVTLTDSLPYAVTNIELNMGSGDFIVTANVEPVSYSATNPSGEISEEYGPLYSYTIENNSSETAEKWSVMTTIILYDENYELLDVIPNSVPEELAPGESYSFEQVFQTYRDYEASEGQRFEICAYKQHATNG